MRIQTKLLTSLTLAVTAPTGSSAADFFNVVSFDTAAPATPAPTLTSITPSSGAQGTSVNVTLTGTNFVSTVGLSASGLVVSNVVMVSSTEITATLIIDSSATTGIHNVYVTAAGGTNSIASFTVNAQ